MEKETKKQLGLSLFILTIIILTMFFWYDNFLFHTYIKEVDYQYCFSGNNDCVMIQGYELSQNSQNSFYGNGRLLSTENNFFLKNDQVECIMTFVDIDDQTYQYIHDYQVKSSNEVCYLNLNEESKKDHSLNIVRGEMELKVKRDGECVYDEKISLNMNQLVVYNGSNKDYSIYNVYANDYWLKTGNFSSTIDYLSNDYKQCIIDYICYDKNEEELDVNNYERMIHISGSTEDILKNKNHEIYYYDQDGKLSDKDIKCVVTLLKDENDDSPLTFVIDLHGTMKAGVTHE